MKQQGFFRAKAIKKFNIKKKKKKKARGKTVILQTELGRGKRKEKDIDWGDGSSVLRHTLQLQPSGSEQKDRKMFKTGIQC